MMDWTNEKLKKSSLYKYCFKLENNNREWILATMDEGDF